MIGASGSKPIEEALPPTVGAALDTDAKDQISPAGQSSPYA